MAQDFLSIIVLLFKRCNIEQLEGNGDSLKNFGSNFVKTNFVVEVDALRIVFRCYIDFGNDIWYACFFRMNDHLVIQFEPESTFAIFFAHNDAINILKSMQQMTELSFIFLQRNFVE